MTHPYRGEVRADLPVPLIHALLPVRHSSVQVEEEVVDIRLRLVEVHRLLEVQDGLVRKLHLPTRAPGTVQSL